MPSRKAKRPYGGYSKAQLAVKIRELRGRGHTIKEVAKILQRSERYIYDVLKNSTATGQTYTVADPIAPGDLSPRARAMLPLTSDAFENFFNAFSGRTLAPVHKDWVEKALSTRRTLINCPPRHAKSTIFSAWFPLWLIARDRNVQILIASQTTTLARKFTNEISYHLAYNQELIQEFGRFRPEMADWPWRPNSGELLVDGRSRGYKSGDLTIQVRGAGQQILGMEANWVICDDAVSRSNVHSETERDKLKEWFKGDLMSRLEPQGHAIVIGQRLHIHDLYGDLAGEVLPSDGTPRWAHINYAAISDWDKQETLWPEKWGFTELMDPYLDLGHSLFEAMYQQNPLPEGEALARRGWIYGDETHQGCLELSRGAGEIPDGLQRPVRIVSLDPSPTRYAGMVVGDLDYNTQSGFYFHVIEIVRDKMNVREMLSQLQRVIETYSPRYFVFEQNAAQRWLLQDPIMDSLRHRILVVPHTTNRNKKDPALGVESLATDFEFGRIRLPYGDADARHQSELLIREALEYPQGATDDLLMALWFIKTNYTSLVPADFGSGSANTGWNLPRRLKDGWTKRKVTY